MNKFNKIKIKLILMNIFKKEFKIYLKYTLFALNDNCNNLFLFRKNKSNYLHIFKICILNN